MNDRLLNEFNLLTDVLYLNHAAVAPWPTRAANAVKQFAEENRIQGATDYPRWLKVEHTLRERLTRLINADSTDDIAILKNTSEALSVVAYSLDWQSGQNIVGILHDFPSNTLVWESLAAQGVEFRPVDVAVTTPEQALMDACDDNTRLLAVSSVSYKTGDRLDLEKLGAFCRQHDILFSVDAIQSLGAIPFDLSKIQADFVSADGHKWMLGPEGAALFYCHPRIRNTMKLHQYGWRMVQHAGNFDQPEFHPSTTATRFECGSPNMLGIFGLEASLSLLEEVGITDVQKHITENIRFLADLLGQIQRVNLISNLDPDRSSGILTFSVEGMESLDLYKKLMHNNVICAARGGGIRFSPHFYTTQSTMERAVGILQQIIQ